jgi:putative exporter of polyketide antibiotics
MFCLAAGVHAVVRSGSSKVAQRVSLGETLNALIAAGLPTVVYGCTVWGWQVLVLASGWAGWVAVWLVAGLVTLVAGLLPAIYIVGYSWGVTQGEAAASSLVRAASPPVSWSEQMLRPFRRRPP